MFVSRLTTPIPALVDRFSLTPGFGDQGWMGSSLPSDNADNISSFFSPS